MFAGDVARELREIVLKRSEHLSGEKTDLLEEGDGLQGHVETLGWGVLVGTLGVLVDEINYESRTDAETCTIAENVPCAIV